MPANNYPEGLDELAILASQDFPEVKHCYLKDLVGFSRALLDALAERGIVWVDAKKQEPVAYTYVGNSDAKFGEVKLGENVLTLADVGNPQYWTSRGYELVPLYTHPAIPGRVALPDVVEAIDLLKTWKTWLGPRRTACDDPKLWDRIDAACAKLATPPTQPSGEGGLK